MALRAFTALMQQYKKGEIFMKTIGMKPPKKQKTKPDKPPEQEKKPEDTA